ncbi:hypothetical protein [Actinocorallia sp. A-T 12471]|nr:hypothetical protein [Actinocorallia sp. A-T 12471]MDX6740733.1 hypothetical protein [Actinocorallia sp. A-T 12471]
MAIYNTTDEWSNARVSISPRVESVAEEFMEWARRVARQIVTEEAR